MSVQDRIHHLLEQARIYNERARFAGAGSRQALQTIAGRYERTARQLLRRL